MEFSEWGLGDLIKHRDSAEENKSPQDLEAFSYIIKRLGRRLIKITVMVRWIAGADTEPKASQRIRNTVLSKKYSGRLSGCSSDPISSGLHFTVKIRTSTKKRRITRLLLAILKNRIFSCSFPSATLRKEVPECTQCLFLKFGALVNERKNFHIPFLGVCYSIEGSGRRQLAAIFFSTVPPRLVKRHLGGTSSLSKVEELNLWERKCVMFLFIVVLWNVLGGWSANPGKWIRKNSIF